MRERCTTLTKLLVLLQIVAGRFHAVELLRAPLFLLRTNLHALHHDTSTLELSHAAVRLGSARAWGTGMKRLLNECSSLPFLALHMPLVTNEAWKACKAGRGSGAQCMAKLLAMTAVEFATEKLGFSDCGFLCEVLEHLPSLRVRPLIRAMSYFQLHRFSCSASFQVLERFKVSVLRSFTSLYQRKAFLCYAFASKRSSRSLQHHIVLLQCP